MNGGETAALDIRPVWRYIVDKAASDWADATLQNMSLFCCGLEVYTEFGGDPTSYQSILHLYLPTKKSELKKPGNGWCAWVFSGASIPFGKYGCGGRIWTDGLRVMSGCPGVYSCRAFWKKPWNYNGLYKITWCTVKAHYVIWGIISSHIVPSTQTVYHNLHT